MKMPTCDCVQLKSGCRLEIGHFAIIGHILDDPEDEGIPTRAIVANNFCSKCGKPYAEVKDEV